MLFKEINGIINSYKFGRSHDDLYSGVTFLGLAVTRFHCLIDFFMKLFRTSDRSVIKYCQEMFHFQLPSITLQRRLEKFETEHCNVETVLIKFVVFLVKMLSVCACVCVCLCFVFMLVSRFYIHVIRKIKMDIKRSSL